MACASTVPCRKRKPDVKTFSEISVGDMLAIKGGAKKDPTLVGVFQHGGRSCVAIHKKAKWLMQHAFGSSEFLMKDSQCQAVSHVIEHLYGNASSGTQESSSPAREKDGGCSRALDGSPARAKLTSIPPDSPSPAKLRSPRKRCSKLGMGYSDPPSPKAAPKRKSSKPVAAADFIVYEHGELRMMIKRRPNCGLVMVADKKAIETVVNLVRKAWEDGKESQRQNRLKRKAEREELITDVDDEDKGRISWNFRFGSWQIHYYPSPGALVKVAMKGLRVDELDFAGRQLSGEEYQDKRRLCYEKAQRMWNAWDKSQKERYPE